MPLCCPPSSTILVPRDNRRRAYGLFCKTNDERRKGYIYHPIISDLSRQIFTFYQIGENPKLWRKRFFSLLRINSFCTPTNAFRVFDSYCLSSIVKLNLNEKTYKRQTYFSKKIYKIFITQYKCIVFIKNLFKEK